jgi:hypothetical protein
MHGLPQLNNPAVLVASLAAFAIGGLWYSPIPSARAWLREAGLTEEQARQAPMARTFGLAALATLVMAVGLAAFIGPKADPAFGLFAGAAAGVDRVAKSLAVIHPFEQRSVKLWLVDSGYLVVALTVMGGILGAWKRARTESPAPCCSPRWRRGAHPSRPRPATSRPPASSPPSAKR